MIFTWWTAILAFFGIVDTATKEGIKAREAALEKRELDEARRITEASDAAIEEHKRRHEP